MPAPRAAVDPASAVVTTIDLSLERTAVFLMAPMIGAMVLPPRDD